MGVHDTLACSSVLYFGEAFPTLVLACAASSWSTHIVASGHPPASTASKLLSKTPMRYINEYVLTEYNYQLSNC